MKADGTQTDFVEKSKGRLLCSAMYDIGRVFEQLARLYTQCAMFHGAEANADELHVDVWWLAEVMDDASQLAARLGANDFGGACSEVEDLLQGFTSLIEGTRFDAEAHGARHTWDNARSAVNAMTNRWDSGVRWDIVQTTQVLGTLRGKLISLDQLNNV
jgi:hypothetical protein